MPDLLQDDLAVRHSSAERRRFLIRFASALSPQHCVLGYRAFGKISTMVRRTFFPLSRTNVFVTVFR
ncbi:MAG: hypothetical protein PVF60_09395, partial [Desulfobacterales bacterium]